MSELLFILLEISLPILLLILSGFIFQKIFKTDVRTITKLIVYVLNPILIFVKIIGTEFSLDLFLTVLAFLTLLQGSLYILSRIVSGISRYPKSVRNATTNALTLINTGNYGIPLIDLSFGGNLLTATSQIFIVIIQSLLTNTFGVYQVSSGNGSSGNALKNILKLPSIYMIVLAIVFNLTKCNIPNTFMVPLDYVADAFIAIALIGLGIQLAEIDIKLKSINKVLIISLLKIICTPILGFLFVLLLGIKGILAQALVIGISTPTAVNSAILAREFNNEPAFAAQIVVVTTLICTLSLPVVIYLVKQFIV